MTLNSHSTATNAVTLLSQVEWVDTDAAGHHHNSAIMRWVEAAEAEMMRLAALPEYFPSAPRVHQSIDFSSKLTFGQTIRTRLWIERVGTTSLTFRFDTAGRSTESPHNWTPAAAGSLVTAHVPLGATRSAPWPREWRTALAPYCAPAENACTPTAAESNLR
ncbi:acyl-CoA thioesterase [Brevibacterium linens]|uniref:acyl-CoA thioesterase n=1 Tax=Brevibacterium linens TaxID=1703 RepID=UPI003BF5351B